MSSRMNGSPEPSAVYTGTDDILPQISWPSTTGKGWTGVTLCSFDQFFPKLPPELRVRVWSFCVLEPRVLELEPNPRCDQIITRNKTPAHLQACREARFEGLKRYEVLGADQGYRYSRTMGKWVPNERVPRCARILINFEIDTIILTSKMFTSPGAIALAAPGMPIKHEKILKLGIHYAGCQSPNSCNDDILRCSALRKLYTVFDYCWDGGRTDRTEGKPHDVWRDVSVAGQSCVECDVANFHSNEELTLWDEFMRLGTSEAGRWYFFAFLYDNLGMGNRIDSDLEDIRDIDTFSAEYDHSSDSDDDDAILTLAFEENVQGFHSFRTKAIKAVDTIRSSMEYLECGQFSGAERDKTLQELRKARAELLKSRKLLESTLQVVIERLKEAKEDLYDAYERVSKERLGERTQRLTDFTTRYIDRRIRYHHRSSSMHDFPTPLTPGPEDVRSLWSLQNFVHENYFHMRRESKKADPHSKAKCQIMSRRGLGRPFNFRESYGEDRNTSRWYARGGITSMTKRSGKSKLKGMIAVRKAKPAAIRDNCVYKE